MKADRRQLLVKVSVAVAGLYLLDSFWIEPVVLITPPVDEVLVGRVELKVIVWGVTVLPGGGLVVVTVMVSPLAKGGLIAESSVLPVIAVPPAVAVPPVTVPST